MREIKIGEKRIGNGKPCFIIAEAGVNHNGQLKLAKQLVKKAAAAGSDAVKFQIFKTEEFCSKSSKYFRLFKSAELVKNDWIKISNLAGKLGIIFTASVFGEESADLLEELGSPVFKIASGDLTDYPLLRYVAKKRKPIVLSTGMSRVDEIRDALNEIYSSGNKKVALLHCVSNYPTKYEETNLRIIETLKKSFGIPVGFSDHTTGTLIPAVAVGAGADIIEKHFTLDKSFQGPDHKLSISPDEFREMVRNIRIVEKALGNGEKKLTQSEINVKKTARRSIVAKVNIPKGIIITKEMLGIKRPGIGIAPKYIDILVGKKAKKDIREDELIGWNKIWKRKRS